MIEHHLDIETTDGSMNTFITHPEEGGPFVLAAAGRYPDRIACAEIDQYAPAEVIERLESTGVNYRLEWYPGAEHGFAFPERQGIFHKASAERHWERLFALFERNLAVAA